MFKQGCAVLKRSQVPVASGNAKNQGWSGRPMGARRGRIALSTCGINKAGRDTLANREASGYRWRAGWPTH
eukprot:6037905-Alexandrium_andersonii.AAC.1